MRTKVMEFEGDGLYGKVLIGRFDTEWDRHSIIGAEYGIPQPLLRQEGWNQQSILVLDVSHPGVGAIFRMGQRPYMAAQDLHVSPTRF